MSEWAEVLKQFGKGSKEQAHVFSSNFVRDFHEKNILMKNITLIFCVYSISIHVSSK